MNDVPPTFDRASGVELFLRTLWGRAYVRVVAQKRELSWLLFDVLLPLIGLTAFVYLYRALDAPPEFVGFVILGGAMTAYWLNVLWNMGATLYWEKTQNLPLMILAPGPLMAILLGMAVGGMFSSTVRAASVVLLGTLVFGVPIAISDVPATVLVFLVTMIALYGLGMVFASLFLLWGREANHLVSIFQEPVYLVSGMYFPVRSLGLAVALVASVIPTTLGLDALRQLVFPGDVFALLPAWIEIGLLSLLGAINLVLARVSLGYMERLSRREGRLTVR